MTATLNLTIVLPKPPIKQAKLYINGQWRSASDGKTRPTISPITETAIADIPEASEQDIEDAIVAARRAFDEGPWPKMTGHERQKILTRVSELSEYYADMDSAIANAFFGIFYNQGGICTAGSRLLVERSIHDAVVDGLVNYVSQIKLGNPLDPEVLFGPLADARQLEKVMQYVKIGQQDGATLRYGGERFYPDGSNGKGYYFQPTIFTNATNEMRIAQEEIFGPVLTVIPFDTEAEAIRIANDTNFGLASGVHTRDIKKAMRVASAMQAGTCWINCYNIFDASVPFGGYKSSGFGRENGKEVMEDYTHTKAIWIDLS